MPLLISQVPVVTAAVREQRRWSCGKTNQKKTARAGSQTVQDVTDRNCNFQPAYKAASPIQGVRVCKMHVARTCSVCRHRQKSVMGSWHVTGAVSIRIDREAECVEAAFCGFKPQLEMLAAEGV